MAYSKRQNEIIETSIKLIAVGGIQKLTIKTLANSLGVSEPAIYRHFKNKMEILTSIISRVHDDSFFNEDASAMKSGSMKQIELVFRRQINQFVKNPAITAIIFSEEIFQNEKQLSDAVNSIMEEKYKTLLRVISQEQKAGVIRNDIPASSITNIIMGTIRLIVKKWNLSGFSFDLMQEFTATWKSFSLMLTL